MIVLVVEVTADFLVQELIPMFCRDLPVILILIVLVAEVAADFCVWDLIPMFCRDCLSSSS